MSIVGKSSIYQSRLGYAYFVGCGCGSNGVNYAVCFGCTLLSAVNMIICYAGMVLVQVQKARTTISLIDNNLGGGLPRSSSVLLYGPASIQKGLIAAQILFQRLKAGDTGLFISTEKSPQYLKSRWNDFGWDFTGFETSGYMKYVDAYTKSIGSGAVDSDIIEYAENPQSLNEISIAVTELNEALWNVNPDVINVFDSGSTVLMQRNSVVLVNYLLALMNKIKETGAIFIIIMEENMQDEKILTRMRHSVDVIIDFKEEDKKTMIRIDGKDIHTTANATGWMPCQLTSKGLE